MGKSKKTIGICGASGFIGGHLTQWLTNSGYLIIPIGRELFSNQERLEHAVSGCDAIINLAGAPINKRWTKKYKNILRSSRIEVTQKLVSAINVTQRVNLFISTSAVGRYPADGICHEETNELAADTFLALLCKDWENEARKVRSDVRLVITRFGIVFSDNGGAYEKISRPYKLGMGISIGHKRNYFSWIYIGDLVHVMQLFIEDDSLKGEFNLTAPEPALIEDMDKLLSDHYKSWFSINVPRWLLKLFMGDSALVLTGNLCVKPQRLIEIKYKFIVSTFGDFLNLLP